MSTKRYRRSLFSPRGSSIDEDYFRSFFDKSQNINSLQWGRPRWSKWKPLNAANLIANELKSIMAFMPSVSLFLLLPSARPGGSTISCSKSSPVPRTSQEDEEPFWQQISSRRDLLRNRYHC